MERQKYDREFVNTLIDLSTKAARNMEDGSPSALGSVAVVTSREEWSNYSTDFMRSIR